MNQIQEIQKIKDEMRKQIKDIFEDEIITNINIDDYVTVSFQMNKDVWLNRYNIRKMKEKLGLELVNIVMTKKSRFLIFEQIKEADQ